MMEWSRQKVLDSGQSVWKDNRDEVGFVIRGKNGGQYDEMEAGFSENNQSKVKDQIKMLTVIQCYALTKMAEDEIKEEFIRC